MASKRYEPEEIVGMPVRRRARDRAVPCRYSPSRRRAGGWPGVLLVPRAQ